MKATNIPATILRLMAAAAILSLATACKVTVYRTAIEVTPSSEYVETGKAITATASKVTYIEHSDGSTEQVSSEDVTTACTWSVSNEAILKAGGNGTFTGATPGDATIKATYANASGDCDVKVTGTRTGIEVRNMNTYMSIGDSTAATTISAAACELAFYSTWSFEYRATYEGGGTSEWHKVRWYDKENDGPVSNAELASAYGLKAEGQVRNASGEFCETTGKTNDQGYFHIGIDLNPTDKNRKLTAAFMLSVAGDTTTIEIPVTQEADQWTFEYRNQSLDATILGGYTTRGIRKIAATYPMSVKVHYEYLATRTSGIEEGWQTIDTTRCEIVTIDGDFLTISEAQDSFSVSENTTGQDRVAYIQFKLKKGEKKNWIYKEIQVDQVTRR